MNQLSDLQEQASNIRKDISSLKTKLHDVYDKKEEWYTKKGEIRSAVAELIYEIRKIKGQLDSSKTTKESIRKQRDEYNKKCRELINAHKKYLKEKLEVLKKSNIRSIEGLKQHIEKIEARIETEALPFNTEKSLMGKINELKRKLSDATKIQELNQKLHDVSSHIDDLKKKGDEEHQKLLEFITAEKDNYTKFIELSRKINELKKLQNEAFGNFKTLKAEFMATNASLQEKLAESAKIFSTVKAEQEKRISARHEQQVRTLEEKSRLVEEKLRNKQKLTTEDLIAFQGSQR